MDVFKNRYVFNICCHIKLSLDFDCVSGKINVILLKKDSQRRCRAETRTNADNLPAWNNRKRHRKNEGGGSPWSPSLGSDETVQLMWNSRSTLSIAIAASKVTRMKRYERLDRGNVGKAGWDARKNGDQTTRHKTKSGTAVWRRW